MPQDKIKELEKSNADLINEINNYKLQIESLQINEKLYNAIFEDVSSGVALIDEKGKFTLYNREFLRLFGLAEESTIKNVNDQNWGEWQVFHENMELLHVDEHPVRKAALTGKKVKNMLVAVRLPSGGDLVWMLISAEPLFREDGTIEKTICTYQDITVYKNAEKDLRESEERLRTFFESSIDAILITHPDGSILTANNAALSMFDMTEEELIKGGRNVIVDLSDQRLEAALEERTRTGRFRGELNFKKKDGTIFPVEISTVAFENKQGSINTVMIVRDISKRKKAENFLRETQEKLNNALENGKIGVWEWDIKTDEIKLDNRMEDILGLGPGAFDGTYDSFRNLVNEEDISHIQNEIRISVEKDLPLETIFRTRTGSGNVRYITTRALIIKDDRKKPVRLSGVCFDVTELKEGTEKLISKLNEDLLRSNRELQSFAYVASHDLQEPLRMVSSFTQLLSMQYSDKLDDKAKEYIDFAVDGAKRMYDLLNDLLTFSRIETKQQTFSTFDLTEAVENVKRNLSLKIKERNVTITVEKLPVISADRSQMIQLFQNLIDNGIKFNKKSPLIHISSEFQENHHLISIRDNGIGIEPQYFERIFKIFQRLVPRNEAEGTGIGLAICKRIVERHGGNIFVDSEPGKGSTFYFTIPKELT